MKESKTSAWIGVVTLAFALGVALLDVLMPGFFPWYGLYPIPVIWMALWSAEEDVFPVAAVASVVSLLAFLPSVIFIGLVPLSMGERTVILSVIWSTVLLSALRKRARRTFKWINLVRRR